MKKMVLVLVMMLTMTGCQSYVAMTHDQLNKEYVKKEEAEKALRQVESDYNKKISDKENQISTAKDKVINGQDEQMQAAANALYSISQATLSFPQLGALEFTKHRSAAGLGSLGKPPTVKEIIESSELIKKYIKDYADNNVEEIKKLKADNDRLLAENGILVKNTQEARNEVKKLVDEKATIKAEKDNAISTAQANLNTANTNLVKKSEQVIAAEKEAREKAEKLESTKREIMIWCGIGAAIAMVGAVYSPVGKGGMAIIAGILAFVAVAIMYIQPWMVLTVGLVGAFSALGYMLYTHHVADKTADNLVNHIQDIKENTNIPDDVKQLVKQSLTEWNSKYDGNNTTQADASVENYIKSKLKNHGRL